jgi:hypothetical protein
VPPAEPPPLLLLIIIISSSTIRLILIILSLLLLLLLLLLRAQGICQYLAMLMVPVYQFFKHLLDFANAPPAPPAYAPPAPPPPPLSPTIVTVVAVGTFDFAERSPVTYLCCTRPRPSALPSPRPHAMRTHLPVDCIPVDHIPVGAPPYPPLHMCAALSSQWTFRSFWCLRSSSST